jgi:patatin-like phospholipase/acyl hydrolase
MKKIRILSIDGGGIRGIIPGTILVRLEKILQKKDGNEERKLGDYFDFIAGTSTGGILSCLYLMPDEKGKAKYSAQDAVDLYLSKGYEIFNRTFAKKLITGNGVFREKYSDQAIYSLMKKYFGNTELSKSIRPSLITSYAITERKAVFFTSVDAAEDDMNDFYLKDVARATSAAPSYFEPAQIRSKDGKTWVLADGGVFANNPALCAYAEVRKTKFSKVLNDPQKPDKPTAKDMVIVSLGTGSVKKQYHYNSFKHAGEIKWLQPIIDILMSGNSETVDFQLKQMFLTLDPENQSNYYRLEPGLGEACSEMDIASAANIQNLHQAGLTFIHNNADLLDQIADKILANE